MTLDGQVRMAAQPQAISPLKAQRTMQDTLQDTQHSSLTPSD